jgi:4-aminobutyrate aminotransferase-like enzyme
MAERLRRVESRNVTFLSESFPVFWQAAAGANVRDVDGNIYVDFTSAFGVALAGHAHPRIRAALEEQSGRLVHGMGDIHPPELKLELLERLSDLAPWDDTLSVLASSGSEAVEVALKTAELATGRSGVLAFEGGYHGLTLGSLAVTERADFRAPFRRRLHDRVAFAPFPHGEHAETLDAVETALAEVEKILVGNGPFGDAIGAVVVEPVQGRAGVRVPPPGFLSRLAELTRSAGALLVFDEIFTGFGRTGTLFALEHEGVIPDLLCVGKALGGGLPLSACMGSREVMDAWPESTGEALHTSTFLGHPLSCATALAFLDVLTEEGLVNRAATLGDRLLDDLTQAFVGVTRGVREVRGRGLLIGIETGPMEGAGVSIATAALNKGLLVLPAGSEGEVVEIAPPAVVSEAQVEFGVECLVDVVRAVLVS